MTTSLSVVIPARAAADTLETAIRSALDQEPPPDEVVVAVASEGRTPPQGTATWDVVSRLAREDARVRAVPNPTGVTPAGLNAAVRASTGAIVARLDAHAILPPGYLQRASATLEATGAGNVGGRQEPVGATATQRGIAIAMTSLVGSGGAAYRGATEPASVDTVYLGVFRRDALEAVGGFDERLVRNQDYELNLRLRRAGWEVRYDPELAVAYAPRPSLAALATQYFQYGRWRRLTAALHPGSLRLRQLLPPLLVVVGVLLLLLTALGVLPVGVLVAVTILYVIGLAVGTSSRASDPVVWSIAIVAVAVMHAAWGTGFLLGPPRGAAEGPSRTQE